MEMTKDRSREARKQGGGAKGKREKEEPFLTDN